MKNIEILVEKEDIHSHMMNTWKTEAFRLSHKEHGFVWQIVEDFARLPRIICDMSEPDIEHPHFYAWMGVLPNREYDNNAVNDLYKIHEMYHAGHMVYIKDISYEGFRGKMTQNELEASVTSEMRAYFELPGLRDESFPHVIYADRFLEDKTFSGLYTQSPHIAFEMLCASRRDVMMGMEESKLDITEKWIKRFSDQNATWFGVWHNRYHEVEAAMSELTETCVNDPAKRKEAITRYAEWLTSEDVTSGTDVPFYDEAVAFNAVYRKHRKDYDDAMSAISTNKKTLSPVME